jgi:hypothetical protein
VQFEQLSAGVPAGERGALLVDALRTGTTRTQLFNFAIGSEPEGMPARNNAPFHQRKNG